MFISNIFNHSNYNNEFNMKDEGEDHCIKLQFLIQKTDRGACGYGVSSSNLYAWSSDLLCFFSLIFNLNLCICLTHLFSVPISLNVLHCLE